MNKITFHKAAFIKTIVFYLISTLLCGWLFSALFDSNGTVYIGGVGMLILLPLSIYIGLGRRKPKALGITILVTILVFVVATFMIAPFLIRVPVVDRCYMVISAAFVAISMTRVFDRCYEIRFRYLAMFLVFIFLVVAYYLEFKYSNGIELQIGIHQLYLQFIWFQALMLVPLSLGLTIDRGEMKSSFKGIDNKNKKAVS